MTPEPPSSDLDRVKQLLLKSELEDLASLKASLQDPAQFQQLVESVLPRAIQSRIEKDDQLQQALEAPIELTIHQSVQRNPEKLANALFPIMGPAIRQSIRDALSKIVDGFNQTLDQSLSPRSLGWRLEALMTGRSFAEVLMAKTLLYKVEQVFLIHRETSLLLAHVEAPDAKVESKDADMVSSMFTAIQDYVQDSFSVSGGDKLETMQVGDLTVVVRQGPSALIAAAVRGTPTSDLKSSLDEVLETIHSRWYDPLRQFEGDTSPFEDIQPLLEDCLETRRYEKNSEAAAKSSYHWWALGTLALIIIGFTLYVIDRAGDWDELIDQLDQTPGIVIQEAELEWFEKSIEGMRDPLSDDPTAIISSHYPDSNIETRWHPYQSLEVPLILKRLQNATHPPEGVSLKLEDGVLTVIGDAPLSWLESFMLIASTQAGINSVDTAAQKFKALKTQIESTAIFFDLARSEIKPAEQQRLASLKPKITSLLATAHEMNQQVEVVITGMADRLGTDEINARLSRERSEKVIAYLESLGVPTTDMVHRSVIPEDATAGEENWRCVTFYIITKLNPPDSAP